MDFQENFGGGKCIVIISILYVLSVLYEVLMPGICKTHRLPLSLSNQFPAFLSYFLSGMIFALFGGRLFSKLNLLFVPCAVFFVILSVFKIPFVSSLFSPFCLCVIVMFLGLNLKIFSNINRKPDYSYALYLVHYPLVMIFTQLGDFSEHPLFAIFSVIGTSFFCAYLLEKLQKSLFERKSAQNYENKNLRLSAESAESFSGGAR